MVPAQSRLVLGDCLERMKELPNASVDMVLTDLPYGTTQNKWDCVIPLDELWVEWNRVCEPGSPVVLFTQQPFTTAVAVSNLRRLKTEWIWEKPQGTGWLNASIFPLKSHENILVFAVGDQRIPYYPQKSMSAKPYVTARGKKTSNYGAFENRETVNTDGSRYPKTILRFNQEKGFHPTQKPVALLEYLINTYSLPGQTILDCTMGSGSTIVACDNTGRIGIGIERDPGFFKIAMNRVNANRTRLGLPLPASDPPVNQAA